MIRFLSQLAKLPMSTFIRGVGLFLDVFREFQGLAEQGLDTIAGLSGAAGPPQPSLMSNPSNDPQEVRRMPDQDLGGDDLKYVSYAILFTKRDLETTFEEERQDIVNYSTDGASYGAIKVAKFMQRVAAGEIPRPVTWANNNYPDASSPDLGWTIPEDDLKYISFVYNVDRRLPRQEREYAREQVKVLREIRDRL